MRFATTTSSAVSVILLLSLAPCLATAQVLAEQHRTEEEIENEFVQTRTCDPDGLIQSRCDAEQQPIPIQWNSNTVRYVINDRGSQEMHPDSQELTDDLKHSVIESFDTWNEEECSDFEMIYDGTTTEQQVGFDSDIPVEDNINLVVWRDDQWPHGHGPSMASAVALTTVTFRPSNGEILSADIELNTDQFNFTDSDDNVDIDLKNTMVHEVGHFLGLDHSPNSSATMYFEAASGETKKRDLHAADIAGLCYIYPEGKDPALSDSTNGAGTNGGRASNDSRCSMSGQPPDSALTIVALLFLTFAFLRRRGEK